MPNSAVPLDLATTSMRGALVPMSFQSFASLTAMSLAGVAAAAFTNSPKWPFWPDAWLITPSLMTSSATGSFHRSEAAPSSCARAVAAARRSTSHASATVDEPPVMLMPSSRASLETIHCPVLTLRVSEPGSLSRGWKGSVPTKAATFP